MFLEESVINEMVQEHLSAIYLGLCWAALAIYFVWRGRWFHAFPSNTDSPIKLTDVLSGFAYFILSQAIVIPAFIAFVYFIENHHEFRWNELTQTAKSWLSLGMILGAYASLVFFYFVHLTVEKRRAIFGDHSPWYMQYLIGASTWLLIFPIVIVWDQFFEMIVLILTKQSPSTQLAVEQLKLVLDHPFLLMFMSIAIFGLVPIAEEFLFRGLLQSWLKKYFNSSFWGIMLAALIFALFHYSPTQGISNIPLLSSLFLLGCFLGFLYEKQRSLWASIGLHSIFNAASILLIIKGG